MPTAPKAQKMQAFIHYFFTELVQLNDGLGLTQRKQTKIKTEVKSMYFNSVKTTIIGYVM